MNQSAQNDASLAASSSPTDHAPAKYDRLDFFIEFGLRGGEELRSLVHVDEQMFVRTAGFGVADVRGYVIYAALDEVQKTAIHLIRMRELLSSETLDPANDRMARLVIASIDEELLARGRRLVEVFLTLVLFATTNKNEYYRHFLLTEDLAGFLHANEDLNDFHGARSANIDWSIKDQTRWTAEAEAKIDLSRAWYLKDPKPLTKGPLSLKHLSQAVQSSTIRSRLKRALPLMTPTEKLSAGLSYQEAYGRPSEAVHFVGNAHAYRVTAGSDEGHAIKNGLLMLSILARCHQLLGSPDLKVIGRLRKHLGQNEQGDAANLVDRMTRREFVPGDFVLAGNDPVEIMEMRESVYGTRSYKVRYFAERPLPDVEEDWFLPRYLQPLFTVEQAFAGLANLGEKDPAFATLVSHARTLPPEEFRDAMRASVQKLWPVMRDWREAQRTRRRAHGKGAADPKDK